jgi:thiol-disulfide isomerase/thioredoxin
MQSTLNRLEKYNKHMKNPIIILAAVIVLGGGAFFFLSNNADKDAMMEKDKTAMIETPLMEKEQGEKDAMMKTEDGVTTPKQTESVATGQVEKPEGAMMAKGSYEAYAPEKLAKAKEGDVVLFFRASWCPTCRALDADIKANLGSIPAGVTILDVNYDDSTPLKQKYGVTYQHTFVQIDANGAQLAKWSKSPTLAALLSEVK